MMNIQQVINTVKARLARACSARLAAERLHAIPASASQTARRLVATLAALWRPAGWALAIPLKVWVAGAVLIFAGLWLHEHDARVRAAAELERVKQQTTQQVVALQSQAEAAVRAANQHNAAAIVGLEAQRRKLARRADQLTAQLQSLRQERQKRGQQIAALPPEKVTRRLAEMLGPSSVVRGPLQLNNNDKSHTTSGNSQKAPDNGQRTTDNRQRTPDDGQLTLSTEAQRKVVAALSDLDSCRAESALQDRRLSNCREQISAAEAEIRTQADSLAKLNQALRAKDAILAARETEFKTELAAARGTWRTRTIRALKFIAVGVGIGLVIR
jgi:vacuolar-type H+-ATPase subunit I/STV1